MLGNTYKSSASQLKAQIAHMYHRDISCAQTNSGSLLGQNFAYSVIKRGRMLSKTIVFISGDMFV
jgi:hypothetical protein